MLPFYFFMYLLFLAFSGVVVWIANGSHDPESRPGLVFYFGLLFILGSVTETTMLAAERADLRAQDIPEAES